MPFIVPTLAEPHRDGNGKATPRPEPCLSCPLPACAHPQKHLSPHTATLSLSRTRGLTGMGPQPGSTACLNHVHLLILASWRCSMKSKTGWPTLAKEGLFLKIYL